MDEIEPDATPFRLPDPAALTRTMSDIAERSQRMVQDWLRRQSDAPGSAGATTIGNAFIEMTARLMANPARLVQAQLGFWQDYMTLWQNTTRRLLAGPTSDGPSGGPSGGVTPAAGSRDAARPGEGAWKAGEVFDYIKQSYLLSARYVQQVVASTGTLDRRSAQKVDYYAKQFMDALSPSSFLLTSPEVLRRTAETGGENLLRGLNNLLADLENGRGRLAFRPAEAERFTIGETIGATPGKVVAQNAVMQLIQYAPTTEMVLRRPLLIVPPWINKFYVLDLRPKNSLVRWAVAQGHTVFMISWIDPAQDQAGLGFEDYLKLGVLDALDAVERASGERAVNTLGYCLGGTLLAAAAAWLAQHDARRIASMALLATMLDFSETGELGVFIDEEQLDAIGAEEAGETAGPDADADAGSGGGASGGTFDMLRASDLIWSFVVNNYVLGNDPFPYDLLYWNSDLTRVPARLHRFYLQHMYLRNELAHAGRLTLLGTPIDLGRIAAPAYVLAAREDHIAPWRSAYRSAELLGGATRFVLAASGHIGGVVNPPEGGKYSHWVGSHLPQTASEWFAGATEMAGSWWPDWHRWTIARGRERVRARIPGEGALTALEEAPGSYVRRAS